MSLQYVKEHADRGLNRKNGQTKTTDLEYNKEINNGQRIDKTTSTTTSNGGLSTNGSSNTTSIEGLSKSYKRGSYNGNKGWLVENTHSFIIQRLELYGTLENRSESVRQSLKNEQSNLNKIKAYGTLKRLVNTKNSLLI